MDIVRLVTSKLNVEDITNEIASPSCGAISLFVGTTRDTFEDRKVVQLEYEAYEEMAQKSMKNLCCQIRDKWSIKNISIHHRLGIVPVKEASVVIAVASPHRAESLKAVEFAINELKASVPIWKKEVYEVHDPEWKENKECSWKKC
ncbi:hypothetical protein R5R35_001338 [Gryllus longicercus]|uniref:Molybdopterin synthase catalytic subunit n=1 Tax=Gryllus longicercus TaxID=2509291 RepID=A0AAN9VSF1_9ORTH|nr:Molybdopterin synthase catalytic subunit 2 [Gryllus bimaculatus]